MIGKNHTESLFLTEQKLKKQPLYALGIYEDWLILFSIYLMKAVHQSLEQKKTSCSFIC